jgi:hypothetical protein
VPSLKQITSFDFNFDLKPGGAIGSQENLHLQDNLRYGLIVKDIHPDLGGVKRASTTTNSEELAHAGRARVQWGIGPLSEFEERPIMASSEASSTGQRSFAGILIPSTKFKGSARAESLGLNGAGQGQLPPWRFDLTQEEQIYNLTYRSQRNPQFGHTEHAINVPVVKSLRLGQKFSESFANIETSASGVLIDSRLPQLVLRYLHREERYRAELQTRVFGSQIGAAARTKVKGKTDRPDEANEAYSLNFSKDF